MEYKVRKFQTPSGTLQYFANLNAEARGKNSSPEERVRRAFGLQREQEEHNTPGLRTDRNGVVSVDYENQGNYVPTVTHKVGTAIGDVGTQLLHGVQTLGSSVVGDVVKGFSPNAANWLERNTFGVISQTPQEKLIRNRQGNNRWNNRISDAANAVSTALTMPMAGKVVGIGGRKISQSRPIQRIAKGRLNFTPKDSRFLVNQEGFRAPKVTDTLKDQEDWFVEGMKKHNPNATSVNESNLRGNVPEYNQIIKKAKKAGTYMKNADGTPFQGDPREWTMLQSKNAQWLDKQSWYTGVPNNYPGEAFIGKTKLEGFPDYQGDVWTTTNKDYANTFAKITHTDRKKGKVFKMYAPKNISQYTLDPDKPLNWENIPVDLEKGTISKNAVTEFRTLRPKNAKSDHHKDYLKVESYVTPERKAYKGISYENYAKENNLPKPIKTDDIIKYSKDKGLQSTRINKVMDGIGTYKNKEKLGDWDFYDAIIDELIIHKGTSRKSVLGNDGMFNKLNPNIFGSVLGAIGLGSLGANKINK